MQHHVFTIAKVCQQFGAEHAVICPGSRSAPLVYAFTRNENIKCYSAVDERSAAFMALGMAQQLQKPVVLISTSGTACLNFFPAIAEAFYQHIPLLILTADRPPELLNQQDGQMIMQKGVFGKHVIGSHELLCFEEDKVDYKLTERIVYNALEETMSENGFGPVHINVPLREPLYNEVGHVDVPKITYAKQVKLLSGVTLLPQLDNLLQAWKSSKKKMVLVGQMAPSSILSNILNYFVNQDDVLVLSDIVSNQHECSNAPLFDGILQFLPEEEIAGLEPDLILSFGGPFVSKSLKIWLKKQKPEHHFRIQKSADLIDTYQNVTHHIQADLLPYLEAFQSLKIFNHPSQKPYSAEWRRLNKLVSEKLRDFHAQEIWCEPTAFKKVLNHLGENSSLQLGNSSSIRWASWNGLPLKALQCFCNRGTSGIDGTISTAIGSAKMRAHKTVTLICGDLSLFYDQNGFWQNNLPSNLKIIILNNGQGNIFNWIDGPAKHPAELPYFTTPNNLSIKRLAEQYGLKYYQCNTHHNIEHMLNKTYEKQDVPVILELHFDQDINLAAIKKFKQLTS